jgi:hypothetical protein
MRASLQYTVANATTRETLDDVRQKAPQQYYTQDRMVTAEDYNILPYTLFNNVLKVKAVNRTSSGVSRYLDVIDTTGKYSTTNIFCQDGMLYRESFINSFNFDFATTNDIFKILTNRIKPIVAEKETQQFFYAFYDLINLDDCYWNKSTEIANGNTGYFYDSSDKILQLGSYVAGNKKYIKQDAIVKFSAGEGNYFNALNQIKAGTPTKNGDKFYIYASIREVLADGTNGGNGNLSNGSGPVVINQSVPTGAKAIQAYAVFNIDLPNSLITSMTEYIEAFQDFGIRYDVDTSSWKIVLPENLNTTGDFSLANAGLANDTSWIIRFQTKGQTFTVWYRGVNYAFESVIETNFYFDTKVKVFDPKTGFTINDQINVLKINSQPDSTAFLGIDYSWYVYKNITEADGYENPSKILVTFPDSDNDGVPDNPELFELIVAPSTDTKSKYVFFQNTYSYDNFVVQTPVSNDLVITEYDTLVQIQSAATLYTNGQLFYLADRNEFYQLVVVGSVYTPTLVTGYTAKIGRQDLYFQYRHNSPNNRRIDPSPNNIVDLYMLTKTYATDYVAWLQDTSNKLSEPTAPTPEVLATDFNALDNYKSISDTIIYNPAKFKPIFGSKAATALQATFKVVKNPNVVVSDNDVKVGVIAAINQYFDIANWDFGETFYFSELSAYLHNALAPNIASVIIVPASETEAFGRLFQINAEYNEIIVSAATVDNVQIISSITAAQLNQV